MYATIENNSVVKFGELASLFPNISFPLSGPEREWLQQNNVFAVISELPFDAKTERLENVGPYFSEGGVFSVRKVLRSPEDIANERHNDITRAIQCRDMTVVAAMSPSEKDQYASLASRVIREERNQKLAECDWTQGKDIPESISSIWAVYRQALRDVPSQQGFPWTVTWPTPPSS